jgi:hypothetical protein
MVLLVVEGYPSARDGEVRIGGFNSVLSLSVV